MCEICPKLNEKETWRSAVLIFNLEQILHIFLMFLLLVLNKNAGWEIKIVMRS